MSLRDEVEARNGREITDRFWSIWWTCPECHRSYPRDYKPDYCEEGSHSRLIANDDIRIARQQR